MKVLTCDDHALFRDGLRHVLQTVTPEAQLLEAGTAAEALRLAEEHEDLELVILDLGLPDQDGLTVLATLRRQFPLVSVVVLSASEIAANVRAARDAGAVGFIPKSSDRKLLTSALEVVFGGGVFFPRAALEAPDPSEAAPDLTHRQQEVATLLAKGLTNGEIAGVLDISLGTVKKHVASILEALDVTNRTEAVRAILELGLIEPERG